MLASSLPRCEMFHPCHLRCFDKSVNWTRPRWLTVLPGPDCSVFEKKQFGTAQLRHKVTRWRETNWERTSTGRSEQKPNRSVLAGPHRRPESFALRAPSIQAREEYRQGTARGSWPRKTGPPRAPLPTAGTCEDLCRRRQGWRRWTAQANRLRSVAGDFHGTEHFIAALPI